MTEEEWLACDDPQEMLFFLRRAIDESDKRGRRKIRLLLAACCRLSWDRFGDPRGKGLIEASECYAGGTLAYRDFRAAWDGVFEAHSGGAVGAHWACMATHYQIWAAAIDGWMTRLADGVPEELNEQAHLARDVFGDMPFRQLAISDRLRTGEVRTLGQAAYEERHLPSGSLDNARLAVLSDALEEAGCTDEAILAHLRSPGVHVRGCWALDLILGKK